MRVTYNPQDSSEFYNDYYKAQTGFGISVYKGRTVMPGSGIGSLFSGLMRTVMPVIKKNAANVGKKLLSTGVNVLADVAGGKNLKQAAGSRFKATGKDLLGDVRNQIVGERASGGRTGRKRKRTAGGGGSRRKKAKTIFD